MWVSKLKNMRWSAMVLGTANSLVLILGIYFLVLAFPSCDRGLLVMLVAVPFLAALRIATMVKTGSAQQATAKTVLEESPADVLEDASRPETRVRYKNWLWWTRFATVITVLQFVGASSLLFSMVNYMIYSQNKASSYCVLVATSSNILWKQQLLIFFVITVCLAALLQCLAGSNVLKWRSFYATQDDAWKAHYREVFDHGIREALCCMGRVKYLSVLEEDEVFSVARLLGDLVAYRAAGTGHLKLMAGLALLRNQSHSPKSFDECMETPEEKIREAADLHKFAEAAYTGPLLDFGRHPFLFPCAWLYRQGILTPWTRNRLPKLDGDNWWRGHAAAFLKYVKLSPEVLRQGRVNQAKCRAAYFVIVLHHLRSVVIAVRGTETPEDLITDSLCRECRLSAEDLDGLINFVCSSCLLQRDVKESLMSFPHHAHSGIVEAARDLFMQIEGSDSSGLLSSLLGAGCECEGYSIRIVGHSLGGAIGALLGLRSCLSSTFELQTKNANQYLNLTLYHRYPSLHVYTYGPLPCVDSVVANACSEFITSIVYNNEFSARLSVGSLLRLQGAAIMAMSKDTEADSAMILRLARHFLNVSKHQKDRTQVKDPASDAISGAITAEKRSHQICGPQFDIKASEEQDEGFLACKDARTGETDFGADNDQFTNPFASDAIANHDPVSEFMESVPRSDSVSPTDPPEMYLPGLVIHIVAQPRNFDMPIWKGWGVHEKTKSHKAYIADRESFKDMIVSPSMFLDHLPWRCHDAMLKLLQARS
ncbi:diacylglycerol lipase-beta isoform X4 [Rosa chinensis]|uniref:diacylglycerol lipase-beta isoform X4 n=1 Tax=Rosa chinensis TaxID=74649 RepID=UPI001AD8FF61|nr:diacylglycerol lipase-beta isoform X4 [Rosa chinensis]